MVTIGTWNVAGKHLDDDPEIDEWLCTKEPAYIYLLRCQHNVELRDTVFEHQCQMCCIYCGETIPCQSCTTQRADQRGISCRRSDSNVAGKSQQSPIFVQIQDAAVENL